MLEWFKALESGSQITVVIFILGAAWGGIKLYSNAIKPKDTPSAPAPEPILKMTLDQYEARTQAKIDAALKEIAAAPNEAHPVKDAEISELKSRLANSEQSFEKQKQFTASLEARLDREANTIGGDDVKKAKQALEAGDTEAATKLFEEIKARTALDVEASARASFALGEIAEQEVRWVEAFAHYSEAASLHPCYSHLISAQKMALHLANHAEAERLGHLSVSAAKKEFGETAPEYGTSLNNLAGLLYATGRYDEAEPLYQQALENTRQALGEDHPDYGIRLNNLAALLEATGRYDEAEPLYRQAVQVLEKSLGPEHPNTVTIKANLEIFLTNHPPKN